MSDFVIREYKNSDIPRLTEIWHSIFGDSESFISDFFRLLPSMGTGVLAVCENEIAGAAYVLMTQDAILTVPEKRNLKAAYIYAVAVDKRFRRNGIGEALTRAAAEKGRETGAEIISTLPAEASLYGWYKKIIGTQYILRRKKELIPAEKGGALLPLSSEEYMIFRENMLKSKDHLRLSAAALEFERIVCADSGGGYYHLGGAICAVCREESRALINELICPPDFERHKAAANIAFALGAEAAVLYTPDCAGESYIAHDSKIIPANFLWNLSFD